MRRLSLPLFLLPGLLPLILAGCSQGYSPNTYASNAAQEEASVQRGVIIGVRPVLISANGTVGAAAGGAVGGVAGAQVSGGPMVTALGAVGGALVGGIGGSAAQQAIADAKGWEYIVQESGDKLVSVTQTSKTALAVGLHVLVISDTQQARIVPDYTVQVAASPPTANAPEPAAGGTKPAVTNATNAASNSSASTLIVEGPLLPTADVAEPMPAAPVTVASGPVAAPVPSPASANPAATPVTPSSTPGEAATPAAASNKSSATATPSDGSAATSVQVVPGTPSSTPPVSFSSAATP